MKSDFNLAKAEVEMGVVSEVEVELAPAPLTALDPGGEAIIIDVRESGPVGRRLLDLGLLPRTHIKMIRRAPLGDPILYELRGYRLCLRGVDAGRVRVRPIRVGDRGGASEA
jgi:ferrous iron transport protein A